jgi:hypothetical protein
MLHNDDEAGKLEDGEGKEYEGLSMGVNVVCSILFTPMNTKYATQ